MTVWVNGRIVFVGSAARARKYFSDRIRSLTTRREVITLRDVDGCVVARCG